MTAPVAVAVLASGRGSNLRSLLQTTRAPGFPARIELVVSNNEDAPALSIAREAGILAIAIDHRPHGRDREAHERAIHTALEAHGIGLVCLAGYMRRLTPFLVGAWAGRMLNIHPSLLPAFPGLDTHRRALEAGVALHGCSVHVVTVGIDEGPILGQAAVPVMPGDTAPTLAARVLVAEHMLYPAVLAALLGADIDISPAKDVLLKVGALPQTPPGAWGPWTPIR